jgi:hypothetical protein
MLDETPMLTGRRRWQDVAKERGISLRILGDLLGRTHSTMLAYSMGKRPLPQDLLEKLHRILGEDVQ